MRRRSFLATLMSLPILRWFKPKWCYNQFCFLEPGHEGPHVNEAGDYSWTDPRYIGEFQVMDFNSPSRKLPIRWRESDTFTFIGRNREGKWVEETIHAPPPGETAKGTIQFDIIGRLPDEEA